MKCNTGGAIVLRHFDWGALPANSTEKHRAALRPREKRNPHADRVTMTGTCVTEGF